MVLSVEEAKARRLSGMKQANLQMSAVEKIHRSLVNGRPPASELKTPISAVTAARILHRELESRMASAGLAPKAGDWGVSIAYISADLSVLGFTPIYVPGDDAGGKESNIVALMDVLEGHIMLGLIFGMVDHEAENEDDRIVMGTRAFINTKQTDEWLTELLTPVRLEMED